MLSINYLPICIFVVDVLMFIIFSVRLHQLLHITSDMSILLMGCIFTYMFNEFSIEHASKALLFAMIVITLALAARIWDQYRSLK